MPLLAQFLWTVFGGFVTWLAKFLTQKVAVAVAIIALLTIMFAGLYLALNKVVDVALVGAANIHPMFGAGVSMVISAHCVTLITSYIVFWSLVELYKWKVNLLQVWTRTI